MRVSAVGHLASDEAQVLALSDRFSEMTHNHPEAMESAQAVALAIFWAKQGRSIDSIMHALTYRYGYNLARTPEEIRPEYLRTERAIDSVPQALSCAIHAQSFEDAIRNAVSLGGDSDTIAAIAGSVAEVAFDQTPVITSSFIPPA